MTSGIHDAGQITRTPGTETAVLAGGCFWGMEDLVRRQPGVLQTRVGYTGGRNSHATYHRHPGHAEALEVVFDPAKTTYRDLLAFFFQIHDPTTVNRQGKAEPEHQDYLERYPNGYTCHFPRAGWVLPPRAAHAAI